MWPRASQGKSQMLERRNRTEGLGTVLHVKGSVLSVVLPLHTHTGVMRQGRGNSVLREGDEGRHQSRELWEGQVSAGQLCVSDVLPKACWRSRWKKIFSTS